MTRRVPVIRHTPLASQSTSDLVAVEEPLQIWINGKPFATLMRSPGEDAALAAGFLFSEGVIQHASQILSAEPTGHPTSQELHIQLAANAEAPPRHLAVSSSCGVCGRASIQALLDRLPASTPFDFPLRNLFPLPAILSEAQRHFQTTGGLHAAALFSEDFQLLSLAEDVGRHNALDKLIGAHILTGEPIPTKCLLLMTSRASFDIVQKAALAAIPAVACLGAASSLAIDLAHACGLRLFSFLREESLVEHSSVEHSAATGRSTPRYLLTSPD